MNEREKLYYQIEIAIDQCENKSMSKEEIEETVKLQTKNIFSQLKTIDRLADNQEEICDVVHNIYDVLDSRLKWLDCLHDEDKYIFDRLLTLVSIYSFCDYNNNNSNSISHRILYLYILKIQKEQKYDI